jgi:hypothetical protein
MTTPDRLLAQFRKLLEYGLTQGAVLRELGERVGPNPAIEQARWQYATNELEIDDKPLISESEGGCWVSAWVWVE